MAVEVILLEQQEYSDNKYHKNGRFIRNHRRSRPARCGDVGGWGEDVLDHIQEYAPLYVMLLMPWDIYSYNY